MNRLGGVALIILGVALLRAAAAIGAETVILTLQVLSIAGIVGAVALIVFGVKVFRRVSIPPRPDI